MTVSLSPPSARSGLYYTALPAVCGAVCTVGAAALAVLQLGLAKTALAALTAHIGFAGAVITYLAVPATVGIVLGLIIQKIASPSSPLPLKSADSVLHSTLLLEEEEETDEVRMARAKAKFAPLERIQTALAGLNPREKEMRKQELSEKLEATINALGTSQLKGYLQKGPLEVKTKEIEGKPYFIITQQFTCDVTPEKVAKWQIRFPVSQDFKIIDGPLVGIRLHNTITGPTTRKMGTYMRAFVSEIRTQALTVCELCLLENIPYPTVEQWFCDQLI